MISLRLPPTEEEGSGQPHAQKRQGGWLGCRRQGCSIEINVLRCRLAVIHEKQIHDSISCSCGSRGRNAALNPGIKRRDSTVSAAIVSETPSDIVASASLNRTQINKTGPREVSEAELKSHRCAISGAGVGQE